MANAAPRPTVHGPTFTRLLARLAGVDVAAPGQALPDRLGQWLDWNHALALAAALDAAPPMTEPASTAPPELAADCARARQALATAIMDDPALSPTAATPDTSAFRQACLARQRAAQASVGRLRGQLRDTLAQAGPAQARLAGVDAAMEAALSPREHALLAKVPDLADRRATQLRDTDTPLDGFRRDLRDVLLAELDLRFQPVDALLAALAAPSHG